MKKLRPPEVKAGIWLDQEAVFIIKITGKNEPELTKITSAVESRVRFKGEGKVFARFGNAFISDQEKKQSRQHNQREKFFKEIVSRLEDVNYLYLFGPGRAKLGLQNVIEKTKGLKAKIAALEPADKMTAEEAKAETSRYFNDMAFKAYKRQLRYMMKTQGSGPV